MAVRGSSGRTHLFQRLDPTLEHSGPTRLLCALRLLTSLKKHVERERALSRTDSLTGISNNRAFKEWLTHYLQFDRRYHHSLALAYIDLDNFKHVNDTLGHSTGDRVLAVVGSALAASVRSTDVVGRLGGDEFAILLPEIKNDSAESFFEKLHQRLLHEMKQNEWPIGFSVGVALFVQPPKDENEALRIADNLMYEVKRSSKNRVVCRVIPGREAG